MSCAVPNHSAARLLMNIRLSIPCIPSPSSSNPPATDAKLISESGNDLAFSDVVDNVQKVVDASRALMGFVPIPGLSTAVGYLLDIVARVKVSPSLGPCW